MQGMYGYVPETNRVARVYSVATLLCLQFVLHVMSIPILNILYLYADESNENLKYVLSRNLLNIKLQNDFIFLCSIVLPPVGHS